MKDATAHSVKPMRTLSEVLAAAGSCKSDDPQEALANAHINYGAIVQLLQEGKQHQVKEAFVQIAENLDHLSSSEESISVLKNFQTLLNQYKLNEQAAKIATLIADRVGKTSWNNLIEW